MLTGTVSPVKINRAPDMRQGKMVAMRSVAPLAWLAVAAIVLSGCSAPVEPAPVEPVVPPDSPVPTTPAPSTAAAPSATPVPPLEFRCEPVPAEVVALAAANADSIGFVADGRAAMVLGGETSHGFPWRVIALGGEPRPAHPEASGTVLWWGPGEGAPEIEPDGRVRGQFGPISHIWNGEVGVFSVPGGVEGQAAAAACPLA